VRQIRDCSTYIADATGQPGLQLLRYSTSPAFETITQASIFTILGEADCGVTSCLLYQGGGSCNVPYVTTDSQVTIDGSYNIIAKRNVAAGYAA